MLPFLKPKQVVGTILARRKPDGSNEMENQEGQENEGLSACSAELIRAVHEKDEAAVASALRSAFQILDAEPHEEGPHTNEESE